jgi:hypothetical protein
VWSLIVLTVFLKIESNARLTNDKSTQDAANLMVTVIANLNNVALAFTAFHILWINCRLLPEPLRPKWYHRLGIASCGLFYSGLAAIVFWGKILPMFWS